MPSTTINIPYKPLAPDMYPYFLYNMIHIWQSPSRGDILIKEQQNGYERNMKLYTKNVTWYSNDEETVLTGDQHKFIKS